MPSQSNIFTKTEQDIIYIGKNQNNSVLLKSYYKRLRGICMVNETY